MRINRRASAAVALVAAVALSQGGALSAQAADPAIGFVDPVAVTIEYGESWGFQALGADACWCVDNWYVSAVVHGAPGSYAPTTYVYADPADYQRTIAGVYQPFEVAPLAAGNYTVDITIDNPGQGQSATTTPSATLKINPARLGIDLRMLPDSSDPTGAIVSARFTGRFVDEYQSSFNAGAARSPEGIWHITVTDENGEVATESSVERNAGDDVLATSFYWADAEPGVQYTASAEFTPSGSSATNFTITAAPDALYTGGETERPVPTSTATGKPDTSLPEPAGFGLPLWAVIVSVALLLALAALVTILSVRLARRPTPATKEAAA